MSLPREMNAPFQGGGPIVLEIKINVSVLAIFSKSRSCLKVIRIAKSWETNSFFMYEIRTKVNIICIIWMASPNHFRTSSCGQYKAAFSNYAPSIFGLCNQWLLVIFIKVQVALESPEAQRNDHLHLRVCWLLHSPAVSVKVYSDIAVIVCS